MGESNRTLIHGQVHPDVAALRNKGNPTLCWFAAEYVRPEGASGRKINEAETIWPNEWHAGCGLDELLLQFDTISADFGEARGVADAATRAHGRQFSHNIDG
jgi:hypothetical protein